MKPVFLFYCILIVKTALAQEIPVVIQHQLESIAATNEDQKQEDLELLQQLEYFRRHPLELNSANPEELDQLHLLTALQLDQFISYRRLLGKLIDLHELQSIPSFDIPLIQKLLPFVTLGDAMSLNETFLSRWKGQQMVLLRWSRSMPRAVGYDTSLSNHYQGSPDHVLFRYQYQYRSLLYLGLTGDKDAGEPFFRGVNKQGFDFYSFHIFLRQLGCLKSLAIGDYTVNLGQGLIQWQSTAFGKTAEVLSIKRQSAILLPYRSSGEFYFNRGLAVTLEKNRVGFTAFVSSKKISGNVEADSIRKFSSLESSGLHRTATEIQDKNKIRLNSIGGAISYRYRSFKAGLNMVAHHFNLPLEKRKEPYNLYALDGQNFLNTSLDYSYTFRNIHVFGEGAIDKNGTGAFISGLLVSASPKADLSFLYRNISKAYQSLFGNAFTEATTTSDEKGCYAAISLKLFRSWQLNAYADLYSFPWLRYRINAPAAGEDRLVQLSWQPGKRCQLYARYQAERKPVNAISFNMIEAPLLKTRQDLRLQFIDQLSPTVSVRSRFEIVWYQKPHPDKEEGFLGAVESSMRASSRIKMDLTLNFFQTEGYNSRIYAYQSDVLYGFSVPAFFNKGFQYGLLVDFQVNKMFSCWLRWTRSFFPGQSSSGSGPDLVPGNSRCEFRLQAMLRFK